MTAPDETAPRCCKCRLLMARDQLLFGRFCLRCWRKYTMRQLWLAAWEFRHANPSAGHRRLSEGGLHATQSQRL